MSDFQRIEELFFEALTLPEQQRRALLAREPAGIRAEVEALLEEDRLGSLVGPTVRDTARSALNGSAGPGIAPGARVGAYEIREEIGSGGMGSVFLALRADDAYHRKVAIKFVRSEYNTILIRDRFERERRILGRLDHPFIARLLDAGSTEYDQPYFVMEYVENGKPITDYAREHKLSREDRVRLFATVCEAVQYAHRNLTVHRDLKPGNILVDSHGNPKLLDFGIAKILSADGSPTTDQTIAAGLQILTPDYASPEHAGGLPVTTSSDVYSLGAVLWELLLEARPPRLEPGRVEMDPPQSVGPDLGGILRMAMQRDPARRYATANDLREDLLRFLSDEPIRARTYSWIERAAQFTRTYRTFFAASLLVTAGLTSVALWSTEVAKQAESARIEAVRQAARAERALQQAEEARRLAVASAQESGRQKQEAQLERNLARSRAAELVDLSGQLLRNVQSKIDGLPGSAPARRELLTVAAAHLEKLARDPAAGLEVHRDLALAYMQLGDLEGNPFVTNRGDLKAARVLFDKAGAILTGAQPNLRNFVPAQALLVRLRSRQAEIQAQLGDRAAMHRSLSEGLELGRKLASTPGGPPDQALPLTDILGKAALLAVSEERYDEALGYARECRAQALRPVQTVFVRDQLSTCWSAEARAENGRAHFPEAIAAIREAIALREAVLQETPANNTARRALLLAYSHLSAFLGRPIQIGNARDPEGALQAMEKAREHAEFIFKSDPDDKLAQRDLAMSTTRLADLLMGAKRYAAAAPYFTRGAELLHVTVRNLPSDTFTRAELVYTYKRLADALRQSQRQQSPSVQQEILDALRAGVQANLELEKAPSMAPGSFLSSIEIHIEMAKALVGNSRRQDNRLEAERHLAQGLANLTRGRKQHPSAASLILFEIRMQAEAGDVYEAVGRLHLAREYWGKAMDAYHRAPAQIQARWPATERESVAAKLAAPTHAARE